jgi:hypothetical protein
MSGSLTTLVVLVTLLHVAAIGTCIWIRVRKDSGERTPATATTAPATPTCVGCSAPVQGQSYDGRDPHEGTDPHTGRRYCTDMAHYRPLCASCAAATVQVG